MNGKGSLPLGSRLLQNALKFFEESWQIIFHSVPKNFQINSIITMGKSVSHSDYFSPWNRGVLGSLA